MPQPVTIPNFGRVFFPDDMSHEDIATAIERDIIGKVSPSEFQTTDQSPADRPVTPSLQPDFPESGKPMAQGVEPAPSAALAARNAPAPDIHPDSNPVDFEAVMAQAGPEATLPRALFGTLMTPTVSVPGLTSEEVQRTTGLPLGASKMLAAVQRGTAPLLEGVTAPIGVLAGGTAEAYPLASRALAVGFAAQMASTVPETIRKIQDSADRGDVEGVIEHSVGLGGMLGFTGMAGRHALIGHETPTGFNPAIDAQVRQNMTPPPAEVAPPTVAEIVAPKTSDALKLATDPTGKPLEFLSPEQPIPEATTQTDAALKETQPTPSPKPKAKSEPTLPSGETQPEDLIDVIKDSIGRIRGKGASNEIADFGKAHNELLKGPAQILFTNSGEGLGYDDVLKKLIDEGRMPSYATVDDLKADIAKAAANRRDFAARMKSEGKAWDAAAAQWAAKDKATTLAEDQSGTVYDESRMTEPVDFLPAEPTGTAPTLRPMENQGDLLSKQEEPFALAQETATDFEKVQLAKRQSELAKAEAAKQQMELPGTQGAINAPGRLTPVAQASSAAVDVKGLSEIMRDLSKGLSTPIRFGRLLTGKFGGYFMPKANLIGLKRANDLVSASHESGHRLDDLWSIKDEPALQGELLHLGDNNAGRPGSMSSWMPSKSIKYRRGEGVAEFVRYWLTDPAEAKKLAPSTFQHFETLLDSNVDIGRVMRRAQDDIEVWRTSPSQGRLRSSISVGQNPAKVPFSLDQLVTDLVDDLHYVRLAQDDVARLAKPGEAKLTPSEKPYMLFRLLRGSYGKSDVWLRDGAVDFKTGKVTPGTSFEHAMKPVEGQIDNFRDYLVARGARELIRQGKETGLQAIDVNDTFNRLDSPLFQKAVEGLQKWEDALMQYSVDAGHLSPESALQIQKMVQDHVPLHRVFEVGAGEMGQEGGTGRGLNAVGSAFKSRHGSFRDIVDPLETYVKNAYTITSLADKNAANIALADLSKRTGMGKWIERVRGPQEKVNVGLEKLKEQLENAGADLSAVPDDLLLSFFRDAQRVPFGENMIRVNRSGQAEYYRLNSNLYRAVQALDNETAGIFLRLAAIPSHILRTGATATPDFAISNMIKDTLSASTISRVGSLPFENTIRGMVALFKNPAIDRMVAEWKASGGSNAIETTYFDRANLQKFLRERITKDLTPAERALVVLKSPLAALRWFAGKGEEATRLGEYQKALAKFTEEGMSEKDARLQAAFESRDLQDFGMRGAQMQSLRLLTAFLNAQIQANYRIITAIKQNPVGWLTKGLLFLTVPKLLEYSMNQNDRDYWDRPQWERDLFYMIPRGKDNNGHTEFFRIPVPFEAGLIFATFPGRILQKFSENDPQAMKGIAQQIVSQFVPNPVPQSAMVALQVAAGKQGYDFFRGRPIVPQGLADLPPEYQFTQQSSLTAKKAGALAGVSPMKIDSVINGITGTLGRQIVNQGVDRGISLATGEARTAEGTMPGQRFIATSSGVNSEAVDRFYIKLQELETAHKRAELLAAKNDKPTVPSELLEMRAVARELSKHRKEAASTQDKELRQRINLQMVEKARPFVTMPGP